jgi:hypothetical protein
MKCLTKQYLSREISIDVSSLFIDWTFASISWRHSRSNYCRSWSRLVNFPMKWTWMQAKLSRWGKVNFNRLDFNCIWSCRRIRNCLMHVDVPPNLWIGKGQSKTAYKMHSNSTTSEGANKSYKENVQKIKTRNI